MHLVYRFRQSSLQPQPRRAMERSRPGTPYGESEQLRETPKLDPSDHFAPCLYPKFSDLAKGARLIPERLAKMRVGLNLTADAAAGSHALLSLRRSVLVPYVWETISRHCVGTQSRPSTPSDSSARRTVTRPLGCSSTS